MSIKFSRGLEEDGIVVGNTYDKYGSANPIVKKIMQGFESSLSGLVDQTDAKTIHEVGCGEGNWVARRSSRTRV
jgi:tRNA G46 methylase TrmB